MFVSTLYDVIRTRQGSMSSFMSFPSMTQSSHSPSSCRGEEANSAGILRLHERREDLQMQALQITRDDGMPEWTSSHFDSLGCLGSHNLPAGPGTSSKLCRSRRMDQAILQHDHIICFLGGGHFLLPERIAGRLVAFETLSENVSVSQMLSYLPYRKLISFRNGRINIIWLYIHRWLRVTPLLGIAILYSSTLLNHLGSGPFWPVFDTSNVKINCENYWWAALLHIQTYYNPTDMVS